MVSLEPTATRLRDIELALSRIASNLETASLLERALGSWLGGIDPAEETQAAIVDAENTPIRSYEDAALLGLAVYAGWSTNHHNLAAALDWLIGVPLIRLGSPAPLLGDSSAQVAIALAIRSAPSTKRSDWFAEVLEQAANLRLDRTWLHSMAQVITGTPNANPELSDVRIILHLAGIIGIDTLADDKKNLTNQILIRSVTEDPLRAHLQLRAIKTLQSSPLSPSATHYPSDTAVSNVKPLDSNTPFANGGFAKNTQATNNSPTYAEQPKSVSDSKQPLLNATSAQQTILEIVAKEQLASTKPVPGRLIRSKLWNTAPKETNNVLESCTPNLLKSTGTRPHELYKLTLHGLLNTTYAAIASRAIENLLRFFRHQEQTHPSFEIFEWSRLRDYLHASDKDFSFFVSLLDIAGLDDGGRLGGEHSPSFTLGVPRDIEQLIRCTTITDVLELRRPSHQEPNAAIQTMPSNPTDESTTIDFLLKFENNKDELDQLRKQLRSRRVTPFIGAGMSIPCGLPGWTEFLLEEASRLGIQAKIQTLLDAGQYEQAAQHIEEELVSFAFNRRIYTVFGKEVEPRGAVTLLPKLTTGPIITTNFDQIVEAVFQKEGQPLTAVWGAKLGAVKDALFAAERRYLIKVHGDARDETERVLTKTEYDRHYGNLESNLLPLPYALHRIFSSSSLLFLGCSLTTDRTVGILSTIGGKAGMPAHYAIVEAPADKDELRQKRRKLAGLGIVPIWYPNKKHSSVEILLRALLS